MGYRHKLTKDGNLSKGEVCYKTNCHLCDFVMAKRFPPLITTQLIRVDGTVVEFTSGIEKSLRHGREHTELLNELERERRDAELKTASSSAIAMTTIAEWSRGSREVGYFKTTKERRALKDPSFSDFKHLWEGTEDESSSSDHNYLLESIDSESPDDWSVYEEEGDSCNDSDNE